jgi:hypothetical protein
MELREQELDTFANKLNIYPSCFSGAHIVWFGILFIIKLFILYNYLLYVQDVLVWSNDRVMRWTLGIGLKVIKFFPTVQCSGSAFILVGWIRIQEGQNEPQK